MLAVISPAKSLNFTDPTPPEWQARCVPPLLTDEAQQLVELLRQCSAPELQAMMSISPALAELNVQRFADWRRSPSAGASKPAVLAFDGDVYGGLAAASWSGATMDYAQQHLCILSGLYGVLEPLSDFQAYRLEMGTRLPNPAGRDLYAFWGGRITALLNQKCQAAQSTILVNLASQEYFKAVRPDELAAELVVPVFQDFKNGGYKVISFYAKRARGLMARAMMQGQMKTLAQLQAFDAEGYRFDSMRVDQKGVTQMLFLREAQV